MKKLLLIINIFILLTSCNITQKEDPLDLYTEHATTPNECNLVKFHQVQDAPSRKTMQFDRHILIHDTTEYPYITIYENEIIIFYKDTIITIKTIKTRN